MALHNKIKIQPKRERWPLRDKTIVVFFLAKVSPYELYCPSVVSMWCGQEGNSGTVDTERDGTGNSSSLLNEIFIIHRHSVIIVRHNYARLSAIASLRKNFTYRSFADDLKKPYRTDMRGGGEMNKSYFIT